MYISSISPTYAIENIDSSDDLQIVKPQTSVENNEIKVVEDFDYMNEENFSESSEKDITSNEKLISEDNIEDDNVIIKEDISEDAVLNQGVSPNGGIQDNLENVELSTQDNLSYDTTLSKIKFEHDTTYLTSEYTPEVKRYTAIVTGNITAINFQPSAAKSIYVNSKTSKMNIYLNEKLLFSNVSCLGEGLYRYALQLEAVKSNQLRLEVISEAGTMDNYYIDFIRMGDSDASLSNIKFDGSYKGSVVLNRDYNGEEFSYIAYTKWMSTIGFASYAAQVTSVKDPFSTMDVYFNGELVQENVKTTKEATYTLLPNYNNKFDFVVKSNSGKESTYTVYVKRYGENDVSLNMFGFDGVYGGSISMDSKFDVNKSNYELLLNKSQTKIGFSGYAGQYVEVNDSYAKMNVYLNEELIFENIKKTPDSSFDLIPGINNELKFEVIAEDGTVGIYCVSIKRAGDNDTTIKTLKINNSLLTLENDRYRIVLDSWRNVKVSNITLNDVWAKYKIILNGEKELSLDEEFDLEIGENKLDIEVTSNDGTKNVYPVVFERSDNINPKVSYNLDNKEWTNEDIVISVSASDDSGIRYMELPNGEKVYSNEAEFDVSQNDIYEFKIYDNFLNETIKVVEIQNIDKELPELELKASTAEIVNTSIDIIVAATDNVGVKYIETPNGDIVESDNLVFEVNTDGNYEFKVVDLAGNEKTKTISITNIDNVHPILITELSNYDLTKEDITLNITAISDKGIRYIGLPDGTKVQGDRAEYCIRENGIYIVATESLGGNITTEKVIVSNIDKELPTLILKSSVENWTKDNVVISVEGEDNVGVDYIVLPNGERIYESTYEYVVNSNGKYEFTVVDLAGNRYSKSIEVNNVDKELPILDIKTSTVELTNESVDIIVSATDNICVKYIETPDGQLIYDDSLVYTVYEDGTYDFKAVDHVGNETLKSITLNNIDSTNPVLVAELSNEDWSNEELILNIMAMSDKGIKYIELPDGSKVEDSIADYEIKENGIYMIATESLGGNITTEKVVVDNIDTELPALTLKTSTEEWTNEDVVISIFGEDNVGIDYIVLPNGDVVNESEYDYLISSNGKYEFTVVDLAGNSCSESIDINNIDKNVPVVEKHEELITVLSDIITLDISNISTLSGIYKIILPNGEEIVNPTENIITFRATFNGEYRFIVVDNAGNSLNVDVPVETIKEDIIINNNLNSNNKYENVINLNQLDNSVSFNDLNNDYIEKYDSIGCDNNDDEIKEIDLIDDFENEEEIKLTKSYIGIILSLIFVSISMVAWVCMNNKKKV